MRWFDLLSIKAGMAFGRRAAGAQLDEEFRFHIERQVAENLAAGMSPEAARYAALRAFGNPALLREQTRARWNWFRAEQFLREIRYGVRTLRRTPGFAIIAVLVMALGIGANVALFTVVRGVLLKPLPFKDPDRLMMLYENNLKEYNFNVVAGGVYAEWKQAESQLQQPGSVPRHPIRAFRIGRADARKAQWRRRFLEPADDSRRAAGAGPRFYGCR